MRPRSLDGRHLTAKSGERDARYPFGEDVNRKRIRPPRAAAEVGACAYKCVNSHTEVEPEAAGARSLGVMASRQPTRSMLPTSSGTRRWSSASAAADIAASAAS